MEVRSAVAGSEDFPNTSAFILPSASHLSLSVMTFGIFARKSIIFCAPVTFSDYHAASGGRLRAACRGALLPAMLLSHNRLICFICDPQGRAARGELEGERGGGRGLGNGVGGGGEVTLIAIMTNDA